MGEKQQERKPQQFRDFRKLLERKDLDAIYVATPLAHHAEHVLAALKTGRPVKWEFTRSEQFTAATTRHPMTITVRLGAKDVSELLRFA